MPGAKDHRVRVTQRLIREAFTGLLKQKPIQSISIKELCEVAGINRGTFYALIAISTTCGRRSKAICTRMYWASSNPCSTATRKPPSGRSPRRCSSGCAKTATCVRLFWASTGIVPSCGRCWTWGAWCVRKATSACLRVRRPETSRGFTPMPAGGASDFCAGGCGRTWKRPRAKSRASPSS